MMVAAHQHGIVQRVLAQALDFFEVFPQNLELFDACDDLAGRGAPLGFWDGHGLNCSALGGIGKLLSWNPGTRAVSFSRI